MVSRSMNLLFVPVVVVTAMSTLSQAQIVPHPRDRFESFRWGMHLDEAVSASLKGPALVEVRDKRSRTPLRKENAFYYRSIDTAFGMAVPIVLEFSSRDSTLAEVRLLWFAFGGGVGGGGSHTDTLWRRIIARYGDPSEERTGRRGSVSRVWRLRGTNVIATKVAEPGPGVLVSFTPTDQGSRPRRR